MNIETLTALSEDELNEYLWRRLRREGVLDPPLGERFGQEPPEQFLIAAAESAAGKDLRPRFLKAIRQNLSRLAEEAGPAADYWSDPTTDQQVASLAFLATELGAIELSQTLYRFALSWCLVVQDGARQISDGQFHILRALARLQQRGELAPFWKSLWVHGPPAIRGLVIFGWARADADAALSRLGELVDMHDRIDLPATAWSLVRKRGPGVVKVAQAARSLTDDQRALLRDALERAGADQTILRDFDMYGGGQGAGGTFVFPQEVIGKQQGGTPPSRPKWKTAA